jgi:hypothetical protein
VSPADHYAAAEKLVRQAAELPVGSDVGNLLTAAQIHATLATVDPAQIGMQRPPIVARNPACICSSLASEPLAKTAMHPDCPIHGDQR